MRSSLPLLLIATIFGLVQGDVLISFPQVSESDNVIFESGGSKEVEEKGTLQEVAYHISNIGLKTLRNLLNGTSNVVISPLNIYSCLGILALGAEGETKKELRQVLGPLNSENNTIKEIVEEWNGTSIASALFLDEGFVPKAEFIETASSELDSSVLKVNYSHGEEARKFINSWVSEHTNGTIEELLQQRLEENTKMVIVSTLLFYGKWKDPFSPRLTYKGQFEVDEGTFVEVQLMNREGDIPVVRNLHFEAISLPYQDDHGMTLHIILPKDRGVSGLRKLLSHFNVNSLKKLRTEMVEETIMIIVPKMKIKGRFSLTDPLRTQGIESMFNPSKANFSGVSEDPTNLFVSEVYHSTHFEIDEKGTVASAATSEIIKKNAKHVFSATRPFLFVITNDSDLVLFVGAVLHPE